MTTATPAPDIATRRATVRQLAQDEPHLSHRAIGARLGISKDTVRRDLEALARADEAAARDTVSQPAAPHEPPCAVGDDPDEVLLHGAAPEIVALARAAQNAGSLDPQTLAQVAHNQMPYLLTALTQIADLLCAVYPVVARHQPVMADLDGRRLRRITNSLGALPGTHMTDSTGSIKHSNR
ncbi:DeoR family transcriptional regulator [Streptomyces sp. NPDC056697]|uniref:DeoR family transcriptional regulator n=1 Tax=Streptomyces sp. NPDC056697 TaxID=3345915 RepID=UPI00369CBD91